MKPDAVSTGGGPAPTGDHGSRVEPEPVAARSIFARADDVVPGAGVVSRAGAVPAPGAGAVPPGQIHDGDGLALARRYVNHLATTGLDHGLIGPRELPRLWSRHVLNCAVLSELVPESASVVDVGSGAGLPGIPLAIARPDLQVTLLEPLDRRCRWLARVVDELGLQDRVTVRRGRAQDVVGEVRGDVVTSRAVAELTKLLRWSVPLVAPGGQVLALKGERAVDELAGAAAHLREWGVDNADIALCGVDSLEEPVRVVRVVLPDPLPADLVAAMTVNGLQGKRSGRNSSGSLSRRRRPAKRHRKSKE